MNSCCPAVRSLTWEARIRSLYDWWVGSSKNINVQYQLFSKCSIFKSSSEMFRLFDSTMQLLLYGSQSETRTILGKVFEFFSGISTIHCIPPYFCLLDGLVGRLNHFVSTWCRDTSKNFANCSVMTRISLWTHSDSQMIRGYTRYKSAKILSAKFFRWCFWPQFAPRFPFKKAINRCTERWITGKSQCVRNWVTTLLRLQRPIRHHTVVWSPIRNTFLNADATWFFNNGRPHKIPCSFTKPFGYCRNCDNIVIGKSPVVVCKSNASPKCPWFA